MVDSPDRATVQRLGVEAGGHQLSYLQAGPLDGAVIVLLHGLASDAETFDRAIETLAARGLCVLALDLIGHGHSDKAERAYLLDDFAESVRDFLDALDIETATLCGHSLGGAIAMHFAVLYPSRIAGLVLVAAGGLGREVHLLLRAASLPVAPAVLRAVTGRRLRGVYSQDRLHRVLRLTPDNVTNLRRAGRALGSAQGQASFFASLRGVIERRGQRGSFIEFGTLSPALPTLIIWNEGDPVIPVAHARAAHRHLPGSRLVVFPGAGHEPHRREAGRFADEVAAFVRSLRPSM